MPPRTDTAPPPAGPIARLAAQAVPVYDALRLLGHHREVRLCHGDQEYRLRLTRNNKLILTK